MTVAIEPVYLDRVHAARFVSLSEPMMERLASRGEFPKPRQLSAGRVAWLVRELREWSESRPVSSLLPPTNTSQGRNRKGNQAATSSSRDANTPSQ
ncbi:MAG: AlpA family phage regulatory protein [Curvibacter sp.]|nr:AlpA family phage regulatory protein [Curvibacter sp.]